MADIGPLPGKGMLVSWRGLQIYIGSEVGDSGLGPQRCVAIGHMLNGVLQVTARIQADDDGAWSYKTQQAGGMGNLVFGPGTGPNPKGLQPVLNALLKNIYGGYSPTAPAVQNSEPFDGKRFDALFYQYMTLKDSADGTAPEVDFKPYP